MLSAYENGNPDDPQLTALRALGWVLQDDRRAQRFLDLTGLSPDALRAGLNDTVILSAALDFLANHEPDLLACAADLDIKPESLLQTVKALR